jgi:hypothetical protein
MTRETVRPRYFSPLSLGSILISLPNDIHAIIAMRQDEGRGRQCHGRLIVLEREASGLKRRCR